MSSSELIAPSSSPQKLRIKVLSNVEVATSGIVGDRNRGGGGEGMRVYPVRPVFA